jgi:hypothetical protein
MDSNTLTQNPFAVLTFIVAPAILTNATSVLAMSTINRMLRTRERMHELFAEAESAGKSCDAKFIEQVNRVELQAILLLRALRWIYTALGAFAAAALVTLIGAMLGQLGNEPLVRIVIHAGLVLGAVGVIGLVAGCVNLLRATQLSLVNISEEAQSIRDRQQRPPRARREHDVG